MAEPRFEIGEEVHIAHGHCGLCRRLDAELKHPVRVAAITPYGDEFEYRLEDASGAHYETRETCLCCSPAGHRMSPCEFCGQTVV